MLDPAEKFDPTQIPDVAKVIGQMRATGASPKDIIAKLVEIATQKNRENLLESYKPYAKQVEFHNAGFRYRERLLRAGNQFGKSWAGAAESAMHLTGKYPPWWAGRRFEKRVIGWVVSEDWTFSKNNAQRLLMGETREDWGTGMIPKADILDYTLNTHASADTIESVVVRNVFGTKSVLKFKSAEVERNKLGGDTIDFSWCDEETKIGHYEEILLRTSVRQGLVFTTFTPLKGATDVVNRFLRDRHPGTHDTQWTIDDDNLYTPEVREAKKQELKTSRDYMARLYAIPSQGDGNVFTARRDEIIVAPFAIPDHWPRIVGYDIGWSHPSALSWWSFDRDTGIAYLYAVWVSENANLLAVVDAWRNHGGPRNGEWIPVAWPHDGDNETAAGAGVSVSHQLRELGMLMLGEPAMLPETGIDGEKVQGRKSVEAQVQQMDGEMLQGRIKVFASCEPFLREYDLYHRENGRIVKKFDDCISAARYGWVMRRYARTRFDEQNMRAAISGGKQNWRV